MTGPRPDLLQTFDWKPSYSHEDGDLVDLFFLPALSCSKLYQRVTGYFNKEALSLASRGLDSLLRNDGRMQLIVGCTLEQDEVDKIEAGYALRTLIQKGIHKHLLEVAEKEWERERLGWLAWMIAHEYLDIKLAIPKDTDGKFRAGLGLYHAKAGLLVDSAGDKLAFRGSINETFAGWKQNCESFDVSCSWRGEWDLLRVQKTEEEFQKLWANKAKSAEVIEVPEAVKRELLQFLPKDDSFFRPPIVVEMPGDAEELPTAPAEESAEAVEEQIPEPEAELLPDAPVSVAPRPGCGDFWRFIRDAAKREDGVMVAVKTSTVEPWPHQLRAYKRMLDRWPFRLLVAEEVGLGKTIEAGYILRHLWLSERARRILIMVPKGILRQWQAEMYEKFNLLVPIYTGHSLVWPEHHFRQRPLEEKITREDWTKQPVVLVSSHLVRRKERQNDVLEAEPWDLIVLDEAHHARRRGAGTAQEHGPNRLLGLMKKLEKKTQSLLLMTATPMQMHPVEIWDLLNLLGLPPEWTEEKFNDYFETLAANPDEEGLHRLAKLFQITEAIFGPLGEGDVEKIAQGMKLSGIDRTKVLKALREKSTPIPLKRLTTKQRQAAMAVLRAGSPVRYLMLRHTRNLLREYAKKGVLESPIADRDVQDIAVGMSQSERALYEAVEDYIRTTYMAAAPQKRTAVGFVMTVYRRRVASSFYALRKTLEKKLARLDARGGVQADEALEEDVPQDEQVDEVASVEEAAGMEAEALVYEQQESIQQLLKSIAKLGTDSKALRLITELQEALSAGYGGAIIFTQYADTMEFLKDFVGDRIDLPIGCYSGSGGQRRGLNGAWSTCSKEETKRLLRTGEIKVLICTDAAGEGLNLQSCGVVINYDLPWNPMKVEQRIGRIDRIGQRFPIVRVVNLGYADTVEVDVYFALSMRIGLFKGVVGKMQPILSRLPKEFERAVLGGAAGREQARQEAVSNVNVMIDEAEAAAFDIDAVSEADLQPPQFPEPPYLPKDVDAILHRQDLLPAGVECKQLEPGTYAVRIPGCKGTARITALPEIFDEHFESHQLFLPGSPIFDAVCARGIGLADTPG